MDVMKKLRLKRGELDLIIGGPHARGSHPSAFSVECGGRPAQHVVEQFANFVNYFRPKALVVENVVGLATHNGGRTVDEMQECFVGLGYECEWKS